MTQSHQEKHSVKLFSGIVSILGVISIFTYFAGWIYLWRYYDFFSIQISRMETPLETFFILPISVFFGSIQGAMSLLVVLIVTPSIIKVNLWLMRPYTYPYSFKNRLTYQLHRLWIFKALRYYTSIFPSFLLYEIVAVFWILASLFCLAQWQGYTDARLDAINETSLRPIVTLISPSDKSALGRNLNDLIINNQSFNNPPLKGYHIIGDAEQFRMIWGRETNDKGNPDRPVWRLLTENSDWLYIFPAQPSKFKNSIPPPVLAVSKQKGQAQLLILRNP